MERDIYRCVKLDDDIVGPGQPVSAEEAISVWQMLAYGLRCIDSNRTGPPAPNASGSLVRPTVGVRT